eukprot:scaffold190893_cov28-Tisochrysis_lutea.AAC.1
MSGSARAAACERFGPGSSRRPRWGVVAAEGWERGAVNARSIAETSTIVFASFVRSRKSILLGLERCTPTL